MKEKIRGYFKENYVLVEKTWLDHQDYLYLKILVNMFTKDIEYMFTDFINFYFSNNSEKDEVELLPILIDLKNITHIEDGARLMQLLIRFESYAKIHKISVRFIVVKGSIVHELNQKNSFGLEEFFIEL